MGLNVPLAQVYPTVGLPNFRSGSLLEELKHTVQLFGEIGGKIRRRPARMDRVSQNALIH